MLAPHPRAARSPTLGYWGVLRLCEIDVYTLQPTYGELAHTSYQVDLATLPPPGHSHTTWPDSPVGQTAALRGPATTPLLDAFFTSSLTSSAKHSS